MARDADGDWSAPRDVFTNGTIVWRTKVRNGRVLMSAYTGGENIYQNRSEGEGLKVLLMTTDDGWTWHGLDGGDGVVVTGGLSETAFEFTTNGDLYAVSRNEAGDATGFGSRLCRASAAALTDWVCTATSDPNKYDSPFMFARGDDLYLIARYNPGGPYDLAPGEPVSFERFLRNEVRYATTTKRTALYGYDKENMAIVPLAEFPSNGDTAFAAGVWLEPNKRLLVFNYSSDPNATDMTWIEGQLFGSQIYAAELVFE